jgi:hypothetical protein
MYGWAVQILYVLYGVFQYFTYIKNEHTYITTCNNGSLNWIWLSKGYFDVIIYSVAFTYAIFVYLPFNIALLLFIVGAFFNAISSVYMKKHYGSIFCFLCAFLPFAFLFGEPFM